MRIALIHAVRVAIDPVQSAFDRLWPEAVLMNLLDDRLSGELSGAGTLTPAISARIGALADYAVDAGADGVLYTFSAFGPAIEAVQERLDCPVLKPNEAMFRAALGAGTRIGLLASFQPSVAPMQLEFEAVADGTETTLAKACAPDAMAALNAGDLAAHDALLAEESRKLGECDSIMLAQFSTARAKDAVAEASGLPVLTIPESAVAAMRQAQEAV